MTCVISKRVPLWLEAAAVQVSNEFVWSKFSTRKPFAVFSISYLLSITTSMSAAVGEGDNSQFAR